MTSRRLSCRGYKRRWKDDIKHHRGPREDVHDTLLARKRRNEPRESRAEVRRKMSKAGNLNG